MGGTEGARGGSNGVAMIFVWGGAPGRCHPLDFPSSLQADQIRWGGVVADIFRDLHKRTMFAGGGVVAEIFSVLSSSGPYSVGGGSGTFFLHFRDTWRSPAISGDSRKFGRLDRSAYTFKERNNIN